MISACPRVWKSQNTLCSSFFFCFNILVLWHSHFAILSKVMNRLEFFRKLCINSKQFPNYPVASKGGKLVLKWTGVHHSYKHIQKLGLWWQHHHADLVELSTAGQPPGDPCGSWLVTGGWEAVMTDDGLLHIPTHIEQINLTLNIVVIPHLSAFDILNYLTALKRFQQFNFLWYQQDMGKDGFVLEILFHVYSQTSLNCTFTETWKIHKQNTHMRPP